MELEIDNVIFKELKMHEKETKWFQILKQKNRQDDPKHSEVNTILLEK